MQKGPAKPNRDNKKAAVKAKTGGAKPFKGKKNTFRGKPSTERPGSFKTVSADNAGANNGRTNHGRSNGVDANGLPKTYTCAATALKMMSERGGSAGSIVVKHFKSYNVKHIYAIVMNCVKNIATTKKIIYELKLLKDFKDIDGFTLEILVSELLFGRGLRELDKVPIAKRLIDRKPALDEKKAEVQAQVKSSSNSTQLDAKYLRINHIKSNLVQVIKELKSCGLEHVEYSKDKIKFKKFINKFNTMQPNQFMVDFHFPNDLIILKSDAIRKVKQIDLSKKGKVIFQDKASFLAVEALKPEPGMTIVDACCAPGMKTSAIATKLRNKGKIFAIDKDKSRLGDADRLLKKLGVTCCKTLAQDFSKVKFSKLCPSKKDKIDAILIDPSCSGSGIKNRPDYKQSCEEHSRLKKLQAFQVALLVHAIDSNRSDAIVYCTCSTSVEENEQVIKMALNESKFGQRWQVVEVLPYWPSRGLSADVYDFSEKCIRSDMNQLTNGFFVARLERNNDPQIAADENHSKGVDEEKLDSDTEIAVEEIVEQKSAATIDNDLEDDDDYEDIDDEEDEDELMSDEFGDEEDECETDSDMESDCEDLDDEDESDEDAEMSD